MSPGPPFPTVGIVSFLILHFEATVADVIVVLPLIFYPTTCGH